VPKHWKDWDLPWYDANQHIASQSVRLHNEIVELTQLLKPSEQEDDQRREAHHLLEEVVTQLFPGSKLAVRALLRSPFAADSALQALKYVNIF
jgi:hypothetical protein